MDYFQLLLLKFLSRCLDALQVLRALSFLNKHKYIVLLYHGVTEDTCHSVRPVMEHPLNLHVKYSNFKEQMDYLSRNYTVISMETLYNCLQNKREPIKKAVVITFDDGYLNNYLTAFPILKSFSMPATIFLVADYVGTKKLYWWDEVIKAVINYHNPMIMMSFQKQELTLRTRTIKDKIKAIKRIVKYKNSLSDNEGNLFLEELIQLLGTKSIDDEKIGDDAKILNWDNICEMRTGNITYGSHTKNHVLLTNCTHEKIEEEILGSKSILETNLGMACEYFAYPSGCFDSTSKKLVKNAGYSCALSTIHGMNDNNTDLYEIRRIAVSANDNLFLFKAKLSGIVGALLNARSILSVTFSRIRSLRLFAALKVDLDVKILMNLRRFH